MFLCVSVTKVQISVTDLFKAQTVKNRFSVNIAVISIFSALWIALNLTVAPISFRLTGLPIIHSIIIFFILLLVIWATNQYGAATLVGIIGSTIVLLAGGPLPVIGFIVAAIIFDLFLLINHHKISVKIINVGIAILGTIVSASAAAIVNFTLVSPTFAITIWVGLIVAGGIIGVILALPIVRILERAQVKKIKPA